jgi:hypothetical protein
MREVSRYYAMAAIAAFETLTFIRGAHASPMVLNCEIEHGASDGYKNIEILIDESQKIVVYNYQYLKGGTIKDGRYIIKRKRANGEVYYVDDSMKISDDNNNFLRASDGGGAFVIIKSSGKFSYAFVGPILANDGQWYALGDVHSGKCSTDPFQNR